MCFNAYIDLPEALLFSATFPKRIEFLARNVTTDPVRINVGTTGQANEDIMQKVEVFEEEDWKWDWLLHRLAGFCVGKTSRFVNKDLYTITRG